MSCGGGCGPIPPIPDDASPFMASIVGAAAVAGAPIANLHTVGGKRVFVQQITIVNPSAAPVSVGLAYSDGNAVVATTSKAGQPIYTTYVATTSEVESAWSSAPVAAAVYLARFFIEGVPGARQVFNLASPIMIGFAAPTTDLALFNLGGVACPPLSISYAWVEADVT